MATDWGLRDFIYGLDDLDDVEKEQCFTALNRHGFSAPSKRRAFLALDDAELQTAGISQMSTRKVLRLAMGAAAGQGTAQAGDAVAAAGLGMGSAAGAGVRPTVFLRSPLPDAALPSRFDKPSRSLKIDHAEPVDCKTWEHVAPQERIPALFGRLAAACGSHATASGFQAMGGAGHGTSSTEGGGGGGGGSSSSSNSGGGGSSFDAEVLTLIMHADDIFCSADGEPIRVLLQQQGPPEVLINEAVACFGTRPLLKVLTILVNGLLERLRGGASADRTAAAAAVGSGAAAKPAPAGITPGVEPAAAGSDAAAVPAARTGRVSSVYWGAEMSLEKIREVASSQEGLEWLVQGGGGSLRPDMPLIVVISDDDATWQQCRSFVEMKAPALMLEGRTPRSLVDLWLSGDTRVRAILAQVNEYMDHLGVRYAIVSCHYAMWAVRRTCSPPPPQVLLENQTEPQPRQQQQLQAPSVGGGGCSGSGPDGMGGVGGSGSVAGTGSSSRKRGRARDGVLHLAGPFLAPTEHTDQQPAVTAAAATLYTMLLSLPEVPDPPAAGLARRRSRSAPPGQPDAGPSRSSGGGDGGGAVGRGGQPGGAAAGGAGHTEGQAVGGAGLAAHGSRAATSPPAGAARRAAAGGEAEAQPSMLQHWDEQGAARLALAPASPSEARGGDGASLAPVTGSSAHHWRRRACCLRQPPPLPPLLIEADPEVLHVGYAGLACTGRVNGEEAVLKILDSDEHGVAAFEAECSAYRALAALQGDVLPRLLAAGRLGDLAPPPPLSGGEEEEEWEPPPDGDVRFIATSRVRGLTLRQAAEQWGYIQPTAAAAAVHALKVLHAADIRAAGGGSGGRFLHGDIRLSNFMFLLPAAEAAVGPRCVVIDLGLSRLDGTEAEQQAEVRQLEQRLQCGSG
ncbi:hypothetical protein CHLRE_17g719834v5 [Chlamydomonas reinhardtii]|uniref:Protein kinase domain-containing protein n=1 Tax=Chlamydomonas reinhardtii TaxID=3055 RepID=A0A2K3CQ82_CHLRE|nr:uncharacterized protein CHLRE_17g719834v5 [Chlamydomonas reinhardtii]PNW70438.1 hypothetical protein CHLRE_17g719834v5 [Chlamydomonas reinhardtii]